MLANDLLQDIPDLGAFAFDQPLGRFNSCRLAAKLKLREI
jgi:hypothetical protein